jgi:hypothetical protein
MSSQRRPDGRIRFTCRDCLDWFTSTSEATAVAREEVVAAGWWASPDNRRHLCPHHNAQIEARNALLADYFTRQEEKKNITE